MQNRFAHDDFAGFWKRFFAFILDALIIAIIVGCVTETIGLVGGGLVNVVAGWAYFVLFQSSTNMATPGKMALKIVVTDENGRRLSLQRATGRYFAKYISGFILMIGYIMAGFTADKQALHDIIAGTLVVNRASLRVDFPGSNQ